MTARSGRLFIGMLGLGVMLACAPALVPASVPTFDPNTIKTSIVQTADAAATQTALIAPLLSTSTGTTQPTPTASITPTATVTFIFILFTPTVPSNTPEPQMSDEPFSCQVLSKNPPDDFHVAPNKDFDMSWHVMNNGTNAWDSNNTDYRFRSGNKLHKAAAYDLETTVPSGGQVDLKVAMKAPQAGGTYSTTWMIRIGQTEFCRMGITILVP
jgi:hypothetical protein